ncbi:MAG: hypothetical protein FWC97_08655 [Treponema sp.]|nr:hypothetical protein [Treponema sp.]
MKKIAIVFVFILLVSGLFAEEEKEGLTSSSSLILQASSLPEAKLIFSHDFVIPFMQGEGPLTSGNNLRFNFAAEATPVSLNGLFNVVFTPIAVIELSAGGRIGTGWSLNLFGGDLHGIGLNLPGSDDMAEHDGSAFDGIMHQAHLGGAFQFDFGAIFPGDWTSVLFRTYHEINFHGYSRAAPGQAWFFEADDGENMNGFNYYGNIVFGYQMPLFLNMVAFMAEMNLFLYDTPNRSLWGDDLIRWYFSSILNFQVSEQFSVTVICQFRTRRNFTADTAGLHFQHRLLDPDRSPQRLEFYRVAGIFTYRL